MNTYLDRIRFLRKHTTHNVMSMYYGVHTNAKDIRRKQSRAKN